MRTCRRRGCDVEAAAAVGLSYEPKEIVLADLLAERDPSLLELCRTHADRLSPPLGWHLSDRRSPRDLAG